MKRKAKLEEGRPASVRERAYHHIQQQITSGQLAPGSGISELQLAAELGSSRTPIREAMNRLAAEGLLEQNAGSGMTVAQVQREHIIELYELREALELYAVTKAALQPMHPTERERIQKTIDQISDLEKELLKAKQETLSHDQMTRFIAADLGFHALLVSLAHNSRLQKIISETRLLISVFSIKRRGHDAKTLKSIAKYHQTILDAVRSQDAEAARAALIEHLQASQKELLIEYDESRREASLRLHLPDIF
ncbi:MAG: GntR family transcriptional regulator [Granulicella sp.]